MSLFRTRLSEVSTARRRVGGSSSSPPPAADQTNQPGPGPLPHGPIRGLNWGMVRVKWRDKKEERGGGGCLDAREKVRRVQSLARPQSLRFVQSIRPVLYTNPPCRDARLGVQAVDSAKGPASQTRAASDWGNCYSAKHTGGHTRTHKRTEETDTFGKIRVSGHEGTPRSAITVVMLLAMEASRTEMQQTSVLCMGDAEHRAGRDVALVSSAWFTGLEQRTEACMMLSNPTSSPLPVAERKGLVRRISLRGLSFGLRYHSNHHRDMRRGTLA